MCRDILRPIIERIRDLPVSPVMVFASVVRALADAESDLDLAVVVSDLKHAEDFDRLSFGIEIRRGMCEINRTAALEM